MARAHLDNAKIAKQDEFYTQLSDIEKELRHYKEFFKSKIIFCNCDDPDTSNFWKFFELNFEHLGFKKLISTHFEVDKPSYKLELMTDITGDGKIDKRDVIRTPLKQNGDFRSRECIDILKEADIIITNPPFSLFREYVSQLIEYNKKFLIIGSLNTISYKEIFPLLRDNKMWLGYTSPKKFLQPNGSIKTFGNILWFTNLETKKRHESLILYKVYNEKEYPKYDNYNAINIDKTKEIPVDYDGEMGVPITFLDKHNPEQFEIIGLAADKRDPDPVFIKGTPLYLDEQHKSYLGMAVHGKATYARIIIKRKETI
jgi:hypothetical protein